MFFVLLILIWLNGRTEPDDTKQEISGLSVGNQYVYKSENHYVKIFIESANTWLVQTEDMNFSERITVLDLRREKYGIHLLKFNANKRIEANDAFFIPEKKVGAYYYLVKDEENFCLVPYSESEDYDIQVYAENVNSYFIKQ
ncbi:hypothetical protein P785_1773 [Enterococcus faecalis KS19]|nr:hypothetical protein P785_1773 [Enterococcus faecalis KS19]